MRTNDSEDFEDELERLKQENQIKRMKLLLEFGADFPIEPENEDLPPEIESQFLDSVAQFERSFRESDRIQVYDFIGKPDFRKTNTIPDSEISSELKQIIQVLNQNQIELDTLCVVDDRILYEFITEELFLAETDNIRIEGMINHFIYEEFHPNHEYDIRNNCTGFFESFLDKESDYYSNYLTKEAEEKNWFGNFRKAFSSFNFNSFEITDIRFDELTATAQFNINFSGIIEGSQEIETFSGSGKIELLYMYDYWCIQEIGLPSNQN